MGEGSAERAEGDLVAVPVVTAIGETGETELTEEQGAEAVTSVIIARSAGGMTIGFEAPRDMEPLGPRARSFQRSKVHGQALRIPLPTHLDPDHDVELRYQLRPGVGSTSTTGNPH